MQSKEYLISDYAVRNVISTFWELRAFFSEEDLKAAGDSDSERWEKLDRLRTTIDLALGHLERVVKPEVVKQREVA